MELTLLFKGIIVGLSVSIPLGPMGVLCVQRTLNKGRISGLMSGLGAATADAIYAFIAAFGLTYVINFLEEQQFYLQLIGGIFILYLGIRIFYSNPATQMRKSRKKRRRLHEDFLSVLFLTLSNPLAVFLFLAVFAGVNLLKESEKTINLIIIVGGIFFGASLWWFLLSTFVARFRKKFRLKRLWWINKISGAIIFLFGLVALVDLFFIR